MSNVAEDAPLAAASGAGGRLGRLPKELWWALLELFALTGLAIAQPLLDVTGKAPDFFCITGPAVSRSSRSSP